MANMWKMKTQEHNDEVVQKHKTAFEEKTLQSKFIKETRNVHDELNSWLWLRKGYLKKETEGLLLAARDQALRTRWIMKNIDNEDIQDKCRLCGEREETIAHVVSECKQLAQNEYKKCRHDKFAAIIHWNLCNLDSLVEEKATSNPSLTRWESYHILI